MIDIMFQDYQLKVIDELEGDYNVIVNRYYEESNIEEAKEEANKYIDEYKNKYGYFITLQDLRTKKFVIYYDTTAELS